MGIQTTIKRQQVLIKYNVSGPEVLVHWGCLLEDLRKKAQFRKMSEGVSFLVERTVIQCNTDTEIFGSWTVKLSISLISKCAKKIQFMLVHIYIQKYNMYIRSV